MDTKRSGDYNKLQMPVWHLIEVVAAPWVFDRRRMEE